jgi:hypothetical protein
MTALLVVPAIAILALALWLLPLFGTAEEDAYCDAADRRLDEIEHRIGGGWRL